LRFTPFLHLFFAFEGRFEVPVAPMRKGQPVEIRFWRVYPLVRLYYLQESTGLQRGDLTISPFLLFRPGPLPPQIGDRRALVVINPPRSVFSLRIPFPSNGVRSSLIRTQVLYSFCTVALCFTGCFFFRPRRWILPLFSKIRSPPFNQGPPTPHDTSPPVTNPGYSSRASFREERSYVRSAFSPCPPPRETFLASHLMENWG